MNEVTKTRMIATAATAIAIAGVAALVVPHAGQVLAGVAIAGALIGMGLIETRKRAY